MKMSLNVTSLILQIISSDNLELDMGNSCCKFVFTKRRSNPGMAVEWIDSINGTLEVSGQQSPKEMDPIGFEHEMYTLEGKLLCTSKKIHKLRYRL